MSRYELADEVELLLVGRSPEEVARVLGRTVSTIARAMYRAGRPDLARPFRRVERVERAARRRSGAAPEGVAVDAVGKLAGRAKSMPSTTSVTVYDEEGDRG